MRSRQRLACDGASSAWLGGEATPPEHCKGTDDSRVRSLPAVATELGSSVEFGRCDMIVPLRRHFESRIVAGEQGPPLGIVGVPVRG